jgi:hypothetical protein
MDILLSPIVLGSIGAGLVLLAFIMGQLHIWKDTYFIYDFINLAGSALLIYYGWTGANWPFIVLNSVWAAMSLKDCVTDFLRNERKKKFIGPWDKWMY